MPTFRHGRNTKILVNDHDLSNYFKDASLAATADTAETTAFGSTTKTYVIGMTDGRVSLGGMFSGDAEGVDEYFNEIFALESPAIFTYAPEGLLVGRRVFGMAAHQSSYSVNGSVSDIVGVSAEFQGTGGAKSGYSIASPLTVISAAGNGTVVDCLEASSVGGWALLHVLTNASTVGATFSIQHSTSAGGTYTTLGTFAVVAGGVTTAQKLAIAPGTTINRYVRFVTAGSIDGNITVHASLIRSAA